MKHFWVLNKTSARGATLLKFTYEYEATDWINAIKNDYWRTKHSRQAFLAYEASSKLLNSINKSDLDQEEFFKQYKPTKKQKTILL